MPCCTTFRDQNNIPAINKASLYTDLKQGYYGGITEVYKPCGTNLHYYDVNSLYPYVALLDMPGLHCSKITYYTDKSIDGLFGFFYCSIEAPLDSYLGLLPIRDKSGINFPVGPVACGWASEAGQKKIIFFFFRGPAQYFFLFFFVSKKNFLCFHTKRVISNTRNYVEKK